MKIKKILSPIVFLLLTLQLSAWGSRAHDAIALIAQKNLTPEAQAEVTRLLNGRTMATYAMWMDNARSIPKFDFMRTWHFVNVDSGYTYATSPPAETGDMVTATELAIYKLSSNAYCDSTKRVFLKVMIHTVGEIHCPMHAGRRADRGGNLHPVYWFGSRTNLHAIWDSPIVERARNWSHTEWAYNLMAPTTPATIAEMQQGGPRDWVEETVILAHYVYKHTPRYADLRFSYIHGLKMIDGRYRTFLSVVDEQLLLGGVRLAYVLNTIFY
ncbi:MAG: S1/P1 nuclease [Bacteroidales bacterium]|nr:S1/P1 nuclease [Bacteroidales bacterium]